MVLLPVVVVLEEAELQVLEAILPVLLLSWPHQQGPSDGLALLGLLSVLLRLCNPELGVLLHCGKLSAYQRFFP